jgi:hypothetical protein
MPLLFVITWRHNTLDKRKKICNQRLSIQYSEVRPKTGLIGIRIMCLSRATCLPANCCFRTVYQHVNYSSMIGSMIQLQYISTDKCKVWTMMHLWLKFSESSTIFIPLLNPGNR